MYLANERLYKGASSNLMTGYDNTRVRVTLHHLQVLKSRHCDIKIVCMASCAILIFFAGSASPLPQSFFLVTEYFQLRIPITEVTW